MARNIEELKKRLGFAGPWSNRLAEAVTHRSYAVENNLGYDNQRLEFLGDAVLEIILTEYLFHLYPDAAEGEMTKIRSALVREPALARLARRFELGEYLLTGRGEHDSGGADRDSTLADLFEAAGGVLPRRGIRRDPAVRDRADPRRVSRPAFAADLDQSERAASGVLPAPLGADSEIFDPAYFRAGASAGLRG